MSVTPTAQPVSGVAGLVLAAGASTRLGQPKQLLQWEGQPLVTRAVRSARQVCGDGVIVVTGAQQQPVAQALAGSGAQLVHNPDWAHGMGTSLAAGMQPIAQSDSSAVLVMLCDQPLIVASRLAALLAHWLAEPAVPVAAGYGGGVGVPAVFPRSWFDRLAGLAGEQGARALLNAARNADNQSLRVFDLPEAATDIDTPADLPPLN